MPDNAAVDIENDSRFRAGLAALWDRTRAEHVASTESLVDALGAWPDTDLGDVVQTAHRLVGTLGMFDLPEGSRLASALEHGVLDGAIDAAAAGDLLEVAESLRDQVLRHHIVLD